MDLHFETIFFLAFDESIISYQLFVSSIYDATIKLE